MRIPVLVTLFLLQTSFLAAQNCSDNNDLLSIPGSLKDHTHSPIGWGRFKATEKALAMKTLLGAENLCKKNFSLKGGDASSWFHVADPGYYDTYQHSTYRLKIGFYQFACVNGKKINSNEYGVDFNIVINPALDDQYPFIPEPSREEFYINRAKSGYLTIPLFRYLSMPATTGTAISSGQGSVDETRGNNYYKHTDVYRNWYITRPGIPVLLPVSRKEFLESLLEFYEREKQLQSKRLNSKINESVKYMAQYQQSGNKAMYQSHLENKQQAEKSLAGLTEQIRAKKQVAEDLLKKETTWLQQPATVDPAKAMRFDEHNTSESIRFNGFYTGANANTLYRYNPQLAAGIKSQPAKPLFFLVQYRYKAEEKFSEQITAGFIKGFDWEGLRKLL